MSKDLRKIKKYNSMSIAPYLFIAPAVIYIICVTVVPAIMALPISFTNWSALSPKKKFVGFDNYQKLFHDAAFGKSLIVMSKFFIYVPIVMAVGLIAAMLLNTSYKGKSFFRVVFYAPVITSTVATAILFEWFYQPTFGLFNAILKSIGLPPCGWVTDPNTAVMSIILFKVWKGFGGCMLIYLAGLQDIGGEIAEAAIVDGANGWQKFWHITFPLLKPAHVYLLMTNIIGVFMIFQETYMLNGPLNSTKTAVNYIYEKAFDSFKMGYASAMSFAMFIVIMIITIIQQKVTKFEVV